MKKTKVYLSGKISGLPRQEYMKRFADAEEHLRGLGYEVCNPTKALPCRFLWIYKILGYKLTLLYDLWLLSRCDKIYMLSGSESSKGAFLEKVAAETFGIGKIFVANWNTKIYFGKGE